MNKSDDQQSEFTNQHFIREPESSEVNPQSGETQSETGGSTLEQFSEIHREPKINKPVHPRRRSRTRPNWYVIAITLTLILGWAFYTFVWPPIHQSIRVYFQPNRAKFEIGLESPVRELYHTCEYLAVIWFFYLGASIGSFFNVLAGRLPEGRGVVFGGSKCPYCQTRLSFRDNIPILGWLSCKGRCSTCKLPIAPRYLLIELLVGAIFVLIASRELFSGGANLPNFNVLVYAGIIWTVFIPSGT